MEAHEFLPVGKGEIKVVPEENEHKTPRQHHVAPFLTRQREGGQRAGSLPVLWARGGPCPDPVVLGAMPQEGASRVQFLTGLSRNRFISNPGYSKVIRRPRDGTNGS